ncbi:30S ribosome-binding factor RbfA [Rickettsiella endosymbiont of Dermanyssus gallinae]|uniref:30S ribosome-binding factor RbfA n=1 Tax=Rickettsiella endosymbiont of Dermanyssus gallinae TaxID=2856608 RepID=UPI001C52C93B|nr:30S ribosome-binding factor RbfA [Rickettsiella endosymbiont of Dermanyssus gallinae]
MSGQRSKKSKCEEYSRTDRIADLIHKELTVVFQKQIADPRLRFITITAVKVTKDLAFADILFTQIDPEHLQESHYKEITVKLLKKAAPRLRYALAQRLKLRVAPMLRFFYDNLDVQSQRLHDLIDKAVTKDQEKKDQIKRSE